MCAREPRAVAEANELLMEPDVGRNRLVAEVALAVKRLAERLEGFAKGSGVYPVLALQ